MKIIKTVHDLHIWRKDLKGTLSFVPTMGALHDGHLALVQKGQDMADICLPYIFVNPKQFAAHEDLDTYPNTLDADLEKLKKCGIDTVYVPQVQEIYPDDFSTYIKLSGITDILEGEFRPHFFEGVCTIVCKMLLQAMPDIAIFGEKDYQQLRVIQKMVKDLNIPVEIIGAPIVRDENGLALSSRNSYLSADQYKIAIRLNTILFDMADKAKNTDNYEALEKQATQDLLYAGFDKVDYCTIRDAQTLQAPLNGNNRLLAAVWLGQTRLIDNIAL